MSNWTTIPLGDAVTQMKTGSTPLTTHPEYFGGDIPWFTPGDIGSSKNLVNAARTITHDAVSFGKAKLFKKGMLLVTCIGDIGRVGVLQQTSSSNQQITALKLKDDIDPDFAYYWFIHSKHKLVNLANQAIVPILNNERLSEIEFCYPPLTEQKRIASLLRRADRLRQLRRAAHDLSDSVLQSVFLEMFGDPETNPKSWDRDDFETGIMSTQNGFGQREHYSPKGIIVLRIRDISSGKIDYSDPRRMIIPEKELAKYSLDHQDLILVRVNGNPNYVGIASEFIAEKEPIVFSDHVIRVKMDRKLLNTAFTVHLLNSPYGRKQTLGNISTTAGQFTINSSGLSRIKMIFPPLSLQEEFAGVVRRVEALRGRMGESERQVENLFESLLTEAFNA